MRLSLDENAAAAAQCNPAAGDAAALERTVSSRDVTAIDSSHEEFATAHASEPEDELPSVNFDSKSISSCARFGEFVKTKKFQMQYCFSRIFFSD